MNQHEEQPEESALASVLNRPWHRKKTHRGVQHNSPQHRAAPQGIQVVAPPTPRPAIAGLALRCRGLRSRGGRCTERRTSHGILHQASPTTVVNTQIGGGR